MTAVAVPPADRPSTPSDAPSTASSRSTRYTLAEGVELLGPYESSGFGDPLFLVRRGDGRMLQLSRLPYLVLAAFSGGADAGLATIRVRRTTDRPVEADDLQRLAEERFLPLELLRRGDEAPVPPAPQVTPQPASAIDRNAPFASTTSGNPLLGLRFKLGAVKPAAVNRIAGWFQPLFSAPVVVLVVLAALAAEVRYMFTGAAGSGLLRVGAEPGLLLAMYGILVASACIHEVGHATACRYGGARPGRIGFGVYIAWPVMFADVSDSYRLDRRGRIRTDLGGLYFNAILMAISGGVFALTHHPLAGAALFMQNLIIVEQLLPVLRLDAYWLVSDFAGVPDLYRYVGPLLLRLVPGTACHPLASRLTRRARVILGAWMTIAVPFLVLNVFLVLYFMVDLAREGWQLTVQHVQLIAGTATGHHPVMLGLVGLAEFVLVVVPMFGLPALAVVMARAMVQKLWNLTIAPVWRLLVGVALFAPATLLVLMGAMR